MPRSFEVFQIIQYGQIQGQFEQINGLNIGGGLRFVSEYTPHALILTVVPTPGAMAPQGTLAIWAVRCRRTR